MPERLNNQKDNELVRRQVIVKCHKQQKDQLDKISKLQKEKLEILQGEIELKRQDLDSCKSRYEQDCMDLQNAHKKSEDEIAQLT